MTLARGRRWIIEGSLGAQALAPLIYFATVVDTKDPKNLGRVQVKLKGFPADLTLTDVWLRMLSPYAGNQVGVNFLPEVDDEVAVLRAADDSLDGMLILGALYNGTNLPLYSNSDGDNITKEIRTKAGNAITITDKSGEEAVVVTTAGAKITLSMSNKSNGSVTIEGADKVLVKGTTSVTVQASEIALKGDSKVEISAGSASVKLESNNLNLGGMSVKVAGQTAVEVTGPSISLG
jgi:uncharacterized protein involved in type VI secretion and phage assembly